jgi:uncharacterized repeat protein (TIGR01451 family)
VRRSPDTKHFATIAGRAFLAAGLFLSFGAAALAQTADLVVFQFVSNASPNVGDTITFTVTLSDAGPSAATNVTVQDLLPAGLTFVSALPSQGSYDHTAGVWAVGTVATGAPQTLAIQATVVSSSPQTNTASVSHSDQTDPISNNNSASSTETPQQADLVIAKTVSNPTPNVGDNIAYTITLFDDGPSAATNVTVQDLLPAAVAFVSSTPSQGNYNPVTGIWTVGTATPGTPQTLAIQATVVSPNPGANTASVFHADQFDPDTANNSDTASVTPQHADLLLTKTVSNSSPNVGDTVTFTVTLLDNGPSAATNVQVSDLLPAGLTFVSATPSQGTYDNSTGLWNVGTVTTATRQTLAIQATVVSASAQTNTATISHSDQFDPDSGNNSASATERPQTADLALTKIVDNSSPNVGDTLTYQITLSNGGPNSATAVTVQDLLPAGLTFVSATPSQGNYNPATGVWAVGTVTTGAPVVLSLQAILVSPNPQTNTASLSHSDQFDPNTANNSASASITPTDADLTLAKTVSNATPNVGDTITFTITLTDAGPSAATSVTVQDLLPAGLTFVSATPSQGSYTPAAGVWTVGSVNTTTPQTLQIQAAVMSPNPRTNTASISHSDQFDPNPGNNSASATEAPQLADLTLSKTVSNATPNVGDAITFTITLTNNGPDPATNVNVADLLPAGLTFVSATPSQGSYNSGTGVWSAGTVTTSTPQTLQIQATVVNPAPQMNTASISHSDQFDPNPGNNSAGAAVTPQQADLVVAKSVSNPTPNVGDTITYTIRLFNDGPDAATNVTVQDTLPAEVAFVSATPSQGTYVAGTGHWAVGTVTPGPPQTLVITATVVSPNPGANTASVLSADQFDPNPGNNSDTASVNPTDADLLLLKTVDNPTPNVGDTVTFTVTLLNEGPNDATGVTVQDLLPAGLSLVSTTPSQGTYVAATGVWTVGTVTNGSAPTLLLKATAVSGNTQTNTATISHSDQFDPDTGNNSASATETTQQADLALSKTVSNPKPNVGDVVTFTVTLSNTGPNLATNVTVQDLLPAGLSLVNSNPSQGTYVGGVWTVGTVTTSTAQTLVLQATVVSATAQTNTASISHSDQFDPNPVNNSASATETPQASDLALAKAVSSPTPNVGDVVTFTVTLTDNGPDTATAASVQDLLPAGLSFVLATASEGSYNSTTGVWTVGTVDPGAPATLVIKAKIVSAAAQTNTVSISHSDQFDPNTGNNTASATETPQQANLALAKTVDNPTPVIGQPITFTVTPSNAGPDAATNVTVQDLLPAGLTFVSATPSQGTYDSTTGIWTVGTVTISTPQTLMIQVSVVSSAPQTNTASISHADQFDPNTANNSASATETPQPQADLALNKIVNNRSPSVGQVITFTITLSNAGPSTATNVTVQDLLPAGLTFVSATPSQGSYSSATGVWSVGTVTTAAAQTLVIQATVATSAPKTNTATITHSDQPDPNTGNNTASALEVPPLKLFTVQPCRVTDTRLTAPIAPGGTLTVTLTGGPCGIPALASEVVINLTVTQPTANGSVVLYAADQPKPALTTLNFSAGQTRANNGIALLATDGSGQVKVSNNSTGTVHVIIDVNGYFQ